MNSMKKQKDMTLKDEFPRLVGAQYATGDQWRNNLRKNEGMEPKQKQHPVVDVTGDGSKVRCYKEQYCIGTWNVRSMNQGKLELVWFQIGKGVRQGCILSPGLFNLYAEYIIRNAGLEETQAGIKIAGRNINNLRHADDTTLLAESEEELKSLLMKVKEEREKVGLSSTFREQRSWHLVPSLHGK